MPNNSDFLRQMTNDLKAKAGDEIGGCDHCECKCGASLTDQEVMTEAFMIGFKQVMNEKGEAVAVGTAKKAIKDLLFNMDMRENDFGNDNAE